MIAVFDVTLHTYILTACFLIPYTISFQYDMVAFSKWVKNVKGDSCKTTRHMAYNHKAYITYFDSRLRSLVFIVRKHRCATCHMTETKHPHYSVVDIPLAHFETTSVL